MFHQNLDTMVAELQDLLVEFQTHMDEHSEKWQEGATRGKRGSAILSTWSRRLRN